MSPALSGAADHLTLIRGARVYDRAHDVHKPPVRDVIVAYQDQAWERTFGEFRERWDQTVRTSWPRGLRIVEKTIKLHRGRMMHKMGARTVAELARIAERAGIVPAYPRDRRDE